MSPDREAWTPPPWIDPLRYTPATVALLGLAQSIATTRRSSSVSGEHIAAALLERLGSNPSADLLLDRMADQARLQVLVADALGSPPPGVAPVGRPQLSDSAVAALLAAADYSEAAKRLSITTSDVLIGLAGVRGSLAEAILVESGVTDDEDLHTTASWSHRTLSARAWRAMEIGDEQTLETLLGDLDLRDATRLGGQIIRLLGSRRSAGMGSAVATTWLRSGQACVGATSPLGPGRIPPLRCAYMVARLAYLVGDRESYFTALALVASGEFTIGRFRHAQALANGITRLSDHPPPSLVPVYTVLGSFDETDSNILTTPGGLVGRFDRASIYEMWRLLLSYPELLSPAGVRTLEAQRPDSSRTRTVQELARHGSWAVTGEIHRREIRARAAREELDPWILNEAITDYALDRAYNFISGLPKDESRPTFEEPHLRHRDYSRFEFDPSDDYDRQFTSTCRVALGRLFGSDDILTLAPWCVQFGEHGRQRAERVPGSVSLLEFALDCLGLGVDATDPSDQRYLWRCTSHARLHVLRYRLTRDIRSLDVAGDVLAEGIFRAIAPDGPIVVLYRELRQTSALTGDADNVVIPIDISAGSIDWARLEPEDQQAFYEVGAADLGTSPIDALRMEVRRLSTTLVDDKGQPKRLWGPNSRPASDWLDLADALVALSAHNDPSEVDVLLAGAVQAFRVAGERATTRTDVARALFGVADLAKTRWERSRSVDDLEHLEEVAQSAIEYADSMRSENRRELSVVLADVALARNDQDSARRLLESAVALEEAVIRSQSAIVYRLRARSAAPSNATSKLALLLLQFGTPASAYDVLERGRSLVLRSLEAEVESVGETGFAVPRYDATASVLDGPGRPVARSSYRLISILSLGRDREVQPDFLPVLPLEQLRDVLYAAGAIVVYLVQSYPGLVAIGLGARAEADFVVNANAAVADEVRGFGDAHDDPDSALLTEGVELVRDFWQSVRERAGSSRTIYLTPCGGTAAMPWHSLAVDSGAPSIRYLPSASLLGRLSLEGVPGASAKANWAVLYSTSPPGIEPLKYGEAEANAISFKWAERARRPLGEATVGDLLGMLAEPGARVHVACHASGDRRDPALQGLALQNGNLLTSDILSLRSPINAELIVLAACESGLAAFEMTDELISLSSSLVAKGAHGVIGNLWPVDDFLSSVTMEVFHSILAKDSDLHPSAAVAQLQCRLLSENEEFVRDHSTLVSPDIAPADFHISELWAPSTWCGLHYVGL